MKKRVLSFLLCLLMVLPLLLVSCGGTTDPDDTEEEEDLYVKPATLNFYIVGDTVAPEAAIEVEKAFNERCRELYKTQVNFVYCTAQQYRERIMSDLGDAKEVFSASGAVLPSVSFENAEVETEVDILNNVIEKYPEIGNNQIDILLITSKDMYDELRAADYLADLTQSVETSFRDIPQRVNSNLINAAKDMGRLYAIPNNVLIGQYKYVLVNKEIMYLLNYYDTEGGIVDGAKKLDYAKLRDFVVQIQQCIDASNDPGDPNYNPDLYEIQQLIKDKIGDLDLYPMNTPFAYPTVSFLPKDGEETIFGVVYADNTTYTHEVILENVLLNDSYMNHKILMLEAAEKGYYPSVAPANAVYGVQYMEGSYTARFGYEDDYFVFEIDQPRLEDDGAFDAMFAVSKYTASVDRSMEIINALVADVGGELRNILQYGVESLHFNVDDNTGLATRTPTGRNQYMMNANYTGNMITAFPCVEDGRDANYSDYFKAQNDSATRNPLYGLTGEALWEMTIDNMVTALVCERVEIQLKAEIEAMSDKDIAALKGEEEKNANLTREALLNGIPRGHNYTALKQYWDYIAAGYDPTVTYKSPPSITAVSNDLYKEKVKPILDAAEVEAEAFASQAATIGNAYMKAALECETAEEFKTLVAEIKRDETADDKKEELKYLYATRVGDGTEQLMGMLKGIYKNNTYNSDPDGYVRFTLYGALHFWWVAIKSVNQK